MVHGVASRNGTPLVANVTSGDVLTSVDGTPTAGLTFSAVVNLLRGIDGERKTLGLERGGAHVDVAAKVVKVV